MPIQHPELSARIKYLRPNARPAVDFICRQDFNAETGEMNVPYLLQNLKDNPVTQQEIDAVTVAVLQAPQLRDDALRADQQVMDLATRLANATPAQIDAWFATDVTNGTTTIVTLKAVVKILALRLR